MLPEIALSEQWLERFKKIFFYPLVWNSKVKLSEKRKNLEYGLKKKAISFSRVQGLPCFYPTLI